MKVSYKISPRVVIEAEGDGLKKVFSQLADLAAVFACADKCGCCGSADVIPQVREPQGFTYYELACRACGASLTFGQHKEGGTLFAKRKDDHGNPKGKGGWEVYQEREQVRTLSNPPREHAHF